MADTDTITISAATAAKIKGAFADAKAAADARVYLDQAQRELGQAESRAHVASVDDEAAHATAASSRADAEAAFDAELQAAVNPPAPSAPTARPVDETPAS